MFGHSDLMWIWGYILTAIVGAIGAIITWFIADFIAGLIARPLLHFFELRSKVTEGLAEVDNVLSRGRREHGGLLYNTILSLLLGRIYADKDVQEWIIRRSNLDWQ